MKQLLRLLLAGTLASVSLTHADVLRLSDPVASDEMSETFGTPLNEQLPRMRLGELVARADSLVGQDVLVDTRIGKVCQKKGCFFIATEGNLAIRVSFRDYGFFVPTDSGGKEVTLAGQLVRRELSPEKAAHFNEDIRDGQPTLSSGEVYEIVADAVRITKN